MMHKELSLVIMERSSVVIPINIPHAYHIHDPDVPLPQEQIIENTEHCIKRDRLHTPKVAINLVKACNVLTVFSLDESLPDYIHSVRVSIKIGRNVSIFELQVIKTMEKL